jgi:hypothetical protein
MRLTVRAALVGVLLLSSDRALGAQALPDSTAAVVATVQRLFDAIATRDTSAARAVLLSGAWFHSLSGDAPLRAPRAESDTTFLRRLATGSERFLERMWAPVVHVQGPLASVWAPYDFHIDGRWSHCGIDTATLVRTAAGWRISALAYTTQRQGCAPSPLGPPQGPRGAPDVRSTPPLRGVP